MTKNKIRRGAPLGNNNAPTKGVHQYTLDGEYVASYHSIASASRENGVSSASIVNCAKGKVEHSVGYIWRYNKTESVSPVQMKQSIVRPGKIFKNNEGLEFEVIRFSHTKRTSRYYDVMFLDTGYRAVAQTSNIINGRVRDYLKPSICGVGFLGEPTGDKRGDKTGYDIWRDMIRRCYDEDNQSYPYYGGIGVTVCARWHNYSLFAEDVVMLEGFDSELHKQNKISLDKDTKQADIPVGERVYSPDTCIFLAKSDNSLLARDEDMLRFAELDNDGGIAKVFKNAEAFSVDNNIDGKNFRKKLHNGGAEHNGKKYILITDDKYEEAIG